jgi:hypothetical protein
LRSQLNNFKLTYAKALFVCVGCGWDIRNSEIFLVLVPSNYTDISYVSICLVAHFQ